MNDIKDRRLKLIRCALDQQETYDVCAKTLQRIIDFIETHEDIDTKTLLEIMAQIVGAVMAASKMEMTNEHIVDIVINNIKIGAGLLKEEQKKHSQ